MTEYIIEVDYDTFNDSFSQKRKEEIVRCRDCKHYVDASPRSTRYRIKGPRCLLFSDNKVVRVKPDGFCAWAERKEDGDDR